MARIKFICCDVFARLACAAVAAAPHVVDLELLPMLAHTEPNKLREDLQARIDRIDAGLYDRIILGYGLCGNATASLRFHLPAVVPRAHDCCAMFMGGRDAFLRAFADNLSMRWCTCGYYERCYQQGLNDDYATYRTNPEYIKLLDDYGEDNADYVWQTLHPPLETKEAVYIRLDGYEYSGSMEGFAKQVNGIGGTVRVEAGDPGWFFRLVNGPWNPEEFLLINPGEMIEPVYDMIEVARNIPQ